LKAVFADTFYWVALTNPDDSRYRDAMATEPLLRSVQVVTTDEILTEFMTFFASDSWFRRLASVTVRRLLTSAAVHVFPQSRESFLSGVSLYEARADKGYSLTDCISMQTMRREGIADILTNDRHFEQEGFRALFRAASIG